MLLTVLSMFAFTLVGSISPGPVNIIATSAGASHGCKGALPHVLGASAAFSGIILALGLGLNSLFTQLFSQHPLWLPLVQYAGALYLLFMAVKIARAPLGQASDYRSKPPTFIDGMLCQLLNPKAWLFSLSGISLFITADSESQTYLLIFSSLAFIVCFLGVGSWALAGTLIAKQLSSHRHQHRFNLVMAALLCVTVGIMCLIPA